MFDVLDDKPADPKAMPAALKSDPDSASGPQAELLRQRHGTLMQCLRDEAELQAEERTQMAIDEDYYDHLQWREEDAQVLMARGQAPLVFNESRQTIDWMAGMQKRMRTDFKILPREANDQQGAEAKTKVFKYVSDANLEQWHVSRAYKQAVTGGLGWLEEGINTDPTQEQIYVGSEDWRNVFRDSRCLDFDINRSGRYLFRKKRTDLDYAVALFQHAKDHLRQMSSGTLESLDRQDDIWYLGERLTGSTDIGALWDRLPGRYRDRSAYIGGPGAADRGRRLAVDLMECWYRVPQPAQFFRAGPLRGQEFDPRNPGHAQIQSDRWAIQQAVVMRMRVMIATESAPIWDGKSPFKHQSFLLVPVWGYRRGRDGMCYGLMRGMRDLNDDINKRASKSLHAASSNRMTYEKGAFDDPEQAREEAARPDMALEVNGSLQRVRFEKPSADMQMNMELLSFDREMMRNVGGVTQANLGQDSRAISGKAIGLQQDQGSLTTSELPDNLRLARQIAGRLRLAHIEQFMTQPQVIRILGDASPIEWMPVNQEQPDGSVLNDLAASQADFIIAERDYRESFAQAAMEEMMELLGKIATYAPQVVMNVLDLVVDSAEIRNKDEWVARIRALNGQRDPTKRPTPEEQQAQAEKDAIAKEQQQLGMEQLRLSLEELRAKIGKLDTEALLKRVESMYSALQAAQIVALTPGVAPVADTIAAGAGFKDQGGQDPNIPAPAGGVPGVAPGQPGLPGNQVNPDRAATTEGAPLPDTAHGLDGVRGGIQTPTGADNGPAV